MKTKKAVSEVLARAYIVENGQVALELLATSDNGYHLAVNGTVPDARHRMSEEEAREWYDRAPYKIGGRP